MVDPQATKSRNHRILDSMRKLYSSLYTLTAFLLSFSGFAQIDAERMSVHAIFEPNVGQWEGPFDFSLNLRNGGIFFEPGGYSVHLLNPEQLERGQHQHHAHAHEGHENEPVVPFNKIQSLAYKVEYLGANKQATSEGGYENPYHRNYFRGNDPSKWASDVPLYGLVTYSDFYPNIDVRYYSQDDNFKYDFVVAPGGNPNAIRWNVTGTEMELVNGELHYKAPFGDVVEWAPVVYQLVNGERIEVPASFKLRKGIASFDIGEYDASLPLIIDPTVVFATFSGSTSDNWGFSATYDLNGGLYGAGICFGAGYPTTNGVYDPNFTNGPSPNLTYVDATISKYSPDGKSLLYATYLGGSESDQPHSMIVNSQGQLIVYGVTGSSNFPTSANSADNTFGGGPNTVPFRFYDINNPFYGFPAGTDAFIAVFSPNGSNLVGSTFIGGSGREAINTSIQRNYGDGSRGEVVVDANDNIYVVTTTFSSDYPLVNSGVGGNAGQCDAGITKLNPNASNFIWSTMYGGTGADQGYGIEVSDNGFVFITGGTNSQSIPGTANGFDPTYNNNTDGYIARFDANGALTVATYLGTSTYDQSFLIDSDKYNAIYVFGQSSGNYPKTSGAWSYGSSRQFIHKFNNDLSSSIFSTAFGSSNNNNMNLVPTAFNVDECLNILLSGWGGTVNGVTGYLGGNVRGLPTTSDAAQSSTDGSDFYFMSLSANGQALTYATYFGGNVSEHVDGGTSRFSPDGQIFQAVCAGCGGSNSFPTTAGAYSQTNRSSNCNLGNVKFNFDVSIEAAADIDYTVDVDTVCNTLRVQFTNNSRNANVYEWDFGNGASSRLIEPIVNYVNFGTYQIRLIAIDTICDISDTAFLTIVHDTGIAPTAGFEVDYTVCDATRRVYLTNNSRKSTNYIWDMGNGDVLTGFEPSYAYPQEGQYTITMIAEDTACNKFDTTRVEVNFVTDIAAPIVNITPSDCKNGRFDVWYQNDSSYYRYRWEWEDGTVEWDKFPDSKAPRSGVQTVKLTIIDDVCNSIWDYEFELDITRIDNRIYIPNAFSPNGDGVNDVLLLKGNTCLRNTRFVIMNRWGQEVFVTDTPFSEFWDGRFNDGNIKEDTYVYVFYSEDGERKGFVTIIP